MTVIKEYIVALVFVVVAASVQAATEDDYPQVDLPGIAIPVHGFRDARNEDPCCLPDKWQSNITGQTAISGGGRRGGGGKLQVIKNIAIYIDKAGGQIAGKGDEGGRFHNKSGGFVMKFNAADNTSTLSIYDSTDGKCKQIQMKNATFKPQCIPANSTVQDITLGPADSGLKAKAWSFKAKSPEDRRGMRMFVCGTFIVADKCLPVAILDRGAMSRGRPHSGEDINAIIFDQSEEDELDADRPGRPRLMKFATSMTYRNVKDSIDDPKAFDVPSYCKATAPAVSLDQLLLDEENEAFTEILERFVSF